MRCSMNLLCLLFLVLCLANFGCSVVKAVKGQDDADLSVLKEGTPRVIVVHELGAPKYTDKTTDVYEACKGDESSMGRAITHGILDVLTLGLWEVVGTPIEMGAEADKECYRITVVYDEDNKLKEVK